MQQTLKPSRFLYERLADRFTGQIFSGVFRTGDRLPSVRAICRSERVSPASVLQAIALLESRGLVETRSRSGTYVRPRLAASARLPAPTDCGPEPQEIGICDVIAEALHHAGNPEMVPLGVAVPCPDLLPTERLSRLVASVVRERPELLGQYSTDNGAPELLRQLAQRFSEIGMDVPMEEIIITFGATEALNLAIRAVTRPGDTVAVESPCYYGFLQILESLGIKVVLVPGCCSEGIDLRLLAEAIESHPIKAVILVPSFNNPNGSLLSEDKRRKLVALLDDNAIPLVEDDIYGDLHFGPDRPRPCRSFDQSGQILYCGSFSKSLAPGLRVGWVAGGKYAERVRRLKWISSLGTPMVNQIAIARYLSAGGYSRHLRHLRRAFQTQVMQIRNAVLSAFPPDIAISEPQGGMFLWVELPEGVDSVELQRRAIVKKIMIVPGTVFCPVAAIRNRIRINCGYPVDHRILEGIQILGNILHQMMDRPSLNHAV